MSRLAVRRLVAGWAGPPVVDGVDLDVGGGEVVALLGGNGSGKSTLLAAVAGLLRPRSGTVHLDGQRVDGLPPDRLAARGLRLLPQTRRVFPSMTVAENLEVVELGRGVARADRDAIRRRRAAWLERFPSLGDKLGQPAASLSGGEQQLIAIGRVLSTAPPVLLLDEPTAGLAQGAIAAFAQALGDHVAEGAAVLLVEQNVAVARSLASRFLHLDRGRLIAAPSEMGAR